MSDQPDTDSEGNVVPFRAKAVRSYEAAERDAIREDGEDPRVRDLRAKMTEALAARNYPEVSRLAIELEGSQRDRKPRPLGPSQIVTSWNEDGPLLRLSTGIEALDALCRGGFTVPRRVVFVGAPGAGKTAIGVILANAVARAASESGACVGILAVDEDPDDITVRLAQLAGYTVEETEARDPHLLADMAEALSALPIRLYDSTHTIDEVATDVATWATEAGKPGVLLVDSLQAARSVAAGSATSIREGIEANMRAVRHAADRHRLLVVTTSEANRGSYQRDDAASFSNDLAAGAESRAIEFGAQTQLMLRTPKDHPDVIHVKVAKNRRDHKGEFWLRVDRGGHTVTECEDPTANPAYAQEQEDAKRAALSAKVERDATELAKVVFQQQPLTERALRVAAGSGGLGFGRERLEAARYRLQQGIGGSRLVNVGSAKASEWRLVAADDRGGN